jgi:hypothetical protein
MSISIVLYHDHYNQEHLQQVKSEMLTLGAPTIKCFYDEANGIWFAVEGCHRLRAAYELGLTPEIEDITDDFYLRYQVDGEEVEVELSDEFFDEWYERNHHNIQLDFEEDEEW